MKQFLDDLRNALKKRNVDQAAIEEIIADHEEIIRAGIDEGYKVEDIVLKLGKPDVIAEELADQEKKQRDHKDFSERFKSWKTYPITTDIVDVHVELVNEDITYRVVESPSLRILSDDLEVAERYNISFEDGKLTLMASKSAGISSLFTLFMSRRQTMSIVVELPSSLEVGTFYHKGVNGNTVIEDVDANRATVSTINGEVTMDGCSFETIDWHTVNGDVTVESVKCNEIKSSQVNGDIDIHQLVCEGTFLIETVSGDVKVNDGRCARCDISTVSGDVRGVNFYPGKISLNSVSGDIDINNEESHTIEVLHKRSLSGSISIRP